MAGMIGRRGLVVATVLALIVAFQARIVVWHLHVDTSESRLNATAVSQRRPVCPLPFHPVLAPSLSTPFILIHQSKSAGTSMRKSLFDVFSTRTFATLGLSRYDTCVPCVRYNRTMLRCEVTSIDDCDEVKEEGVVIPQGRPLVAVAGHFSLVPTVAGLIARNSLPAGTAVPCLTYVRQPISRIVSYFYWYRRRYFPDEPPVLLHKLSPHDALRAIVDLGREEPNLPQYGHFPMLIQFGNLSDDAVREHSIGQMRRAGAVARAQLQRCVVGDGDDLDTSAELVQHFFPWLGHALQSSTLPKENHLTGVPLPTADTASASGEV
jgi:hypothetical protein